MGKMTVMEENIKNNPEIFKDEDYQNFLINFKKFKNKKEESKKYLGLSLSNLWYSIGSYLFWNKYATDREKQDLELKLRKIEKKVLLIKNTQIKAGLQDFLQKLQHKVQLILLEIKAKWNSP